MKATPSAVGHLVGECGARVYEFALAACGNPGEAEEILQQSFAVAFSERRLVQEEASCRSLIKIAAKKILGRFRELEAEALAFLPTAPPVEEFGPRSFARWHRDPQRLYSPPEFHRILREALQTLPLLPRVAVMLRDRERFSIQETARLLGLSVPAAKACLLQARLRLRNHLDNYFRQPERINDREANRS